MDAEHAVRIAPGDAELASEPGHAQADAMQDITGELATWLESVDDPAVFFQPNPALAEGCRSLLRACHAQLAAHLKLTANGSSGSALALQLHVDGFDAEQIWAQLDMQTGRPLKRAGRAASAMPTGMSMLDPGMEDAVETLLATGPLAATSASDQSASDAAREGDSATSDDDEDAEEARTQARGDLADVDYDQMLQDAVAASDSDASQPDDDDEDEDDEAEAAQEEARALLPCEDEFLKLSDMDAFVRQAEAAEELGDRGGLAEFDVAREGAEGAGELGSAAGAAWARRQARGDDKGSGDDGSDEDGLDGGGVDLFAHFSGDEAGGDEDGGGDSSDEGAAGVMHDDFFGAAKAAGRRGSARPRRSEPSASDAEDESDDGDDLSEGDESEDEEAPARRPRSAGAPQAEEHLSSHERRTARIQEQIAAMEEAAMGGAAWHMRGEATAAARPVDSALAMDLDFEQTMRAPPQPTAEAATALEDLIKGRIREMRFDNVVRVAVAAPRKERAALELDDSRSKAGLADVYEDELSQRSGGAAADKKAAVRVEAKKLFTKLCAKLDALSHLSLVPKPVVSDLEVRVDTAAIAMEEAAPVTASVANLRAPEEVHAAARKDVAQKAEEELTQSERRQRRATKKRVHKRKFAEREDQQAVAAHPKGIKSAREEAAADKAAKAARKAAKSGRTRTAGTGVFQRLQDEQQGTRSGAAAEAAPSAQAKSSQYRM